MDERVELIFGLGGLQRKGRHGFGEPLLGVGEKYLRGEKLPVLPTEFIVVVRDQLGELFEALEPALVIFHFRPFNCSCGLVSIGRAERGWQADFHAAHSAGAARC